MELKDTYRTITDPMQVNMRERSSKFLTYIYPVEREEQIAEHLSVLRKQYYDATHHCYAWRLGKRGERSRANDDGEPSGTAGRPILGQMLSKEVTNCLIVVIRYFGGTKLGVPGLIAAYKGAAADALEQSNIVELTIDREFRIDFPYIAMNDVMRIIKDEQPTIREQLFDNECTILMAMREQRAEVLVQKLKKIEGLSLDEITNE